LKRFSGTTTLFTEATEPGPQPVTFIASVVVHGLAFSLLWFALIYKPPFTKIVNDRFSVRELELHMPDWDGRTKPRPTPKLHPHELPAPPAPAAAPQTAQLKTGPQTIVQPDVRKTIQLPDEVPLPQVVIWQAAKVQVKTITPPLPKPTSAEVKPSVVTPNQELTLADVNIASTFTPSPRNIVQPSTTSPLAVHSPKPEVQGPPATASQNSLQSTPVTILSLSDLRAKDENVSLPPVSEAKASNTQGTGQGQGQNSGTAQNSISKTNGNGSGQGSGSNSGSDDTGTATATLITVAKEGHFGSVIVGDSLQDRYPEIGDVWSGRLTYSAYLHVGLTKSWILQFSLPRSAANASAGAVVHLDAPWPYSIVRPNLQPGSVDADALLIHGFVNQAGRFETLAVIFPQAFPQAQFVLAALQQWQFRPAVQDGKPAKVEILLIIPDNYE
jgi:hypothetical protein